MEQLKGKISLDEIDKEINMSKVVSLTSKNEGNTIFHKTKKWLSSNYDLRMNMISLSVEYKIKSSDVWEPCNENELYVTANESKIKVPNYKLKAILGSDFLEKFNPITSYYDSLPSWDGVDHISKLASYLKLAPGQIQYDFFVQFTKWLVRTVKCSTTEGYFNKQAFVLSDDGKGQNIGKTSFLRFLCPKILDKYYTENLTGNQKDDLIQLAKNLFINLDELAGLNKKELTKMKAAMSTAAVNVRLPFGTTNVLVQRVCSFMGSTNETNFLFDSTGSVRWVCFVIDSIDFKYRNEINIDLVWAQALHLSRDPKFKAEMSKEEIKANEMRNNKFYTMSIEEELISQYFGVPDPTISKDNLIWLTATGVILKLREKAPLITIRSYPAIIGKALNKLGYEKTKLDGLYGYYLKEIE